MSKDENSGFFTNLIGGIRFLIAALHYRSGLAVLGLALLLPMAGAGRGLGVPYLYWRESWVEQFIVGLTVGVVFWHLGFVAYVLVASERDLLPDAGAKHEYTPAAKAEVSRHVYYTLVPLLVLLAIGATVLCSSLGTFEPKRLPPKQGLPFAGGLFASFLLAQLTLIAVGVLGRPLDWFASKAFNLAKCLNSGVRWIFEKVMGFAPENHLGALERAYGKRWHVFGMMILFSVLIVLAWLVLSAIAMWGFDLFRKIPAAVPYCVALGLFGSVFGLLRTLARRLTLPVIFVVVLFAGWQSCRFPDNMMMPDGETPPREAQWNDRSASLRAERPDEPATPLVNDDNALAALIEGDSDPVVIITTSGGGIRSAAWTVAIFSRLEELDPEFFTRVRLITGASGGMVGASHWVAERLHKGLEADDVYERATASSLYAPLGSWLLTTPGRNRGAALELAWERAAPELGEPLHALYEEELAGEIPSLVFAPMLIDDGSQMLMSNLDLDWYAAADRWNNEWDEEERRWLHNSCSFEDFSPAEGTCANARQFFARIPSAKVKISTLARINASFPYVSPAVALPFAESPLAVDAGYYDNYGIKLATEWIIRHTRGCPERAEKAKARGDAPVTCLNGRPILLLELRDHDPDRPISRGWSRAVLQELMSPIQGLFGARLHVATHRNAAAVNELRRELGDSFAHLVFHFPGEATLGWELTEKERTKIWDEAEKECSWVALAQWWSVSKPDSNAEPTKVARPECLPANSE